ncbi:hypothetical protein BJY04DRAFT_221980 [Aspergillus karnatakaensis]|uniref:uncharacterized protein n=1 Tax=Aspergillus karnatakaensis TaxID=1810916 RepID=UPI003CCDC519
MVLLEKMKEVNSLEFVRAMISDLERRTKDALDVLEEKSGVRNWMLQYALTRLMRLSASPRRWDHTSFTFAPDFLRTCPPSRLEEIRKLSRRGGPDLSDIRDHPTPAHSTDQSIDPTTSASQSAVDTESNTSCYDQHLEEHMENHGVYMPHYFYRRDIKPPKPANYKVIKARLKKPRPSLAEWSCLPEESQEKDLGKFLRLNASSRTKQLAAQNILPILESENKSPFQTSGNLPFTNLAPLTDGSLPPARPTLYAGAPPAQLHPSIQQQLADQITPTAPGAHPILPNFFLEIKDYEAYLIKGLRQACYNGALGARAMHSLQQFGTTSTPASYDNNAYTMTATYQDGMLALYTTHPAKLSCYQDNPTRDQDYVMTPLGTWSVAGSSPETYLESITAYRNARDLAKEQRDEIIRAANERYESECWRTLVSSS